MSEKPQLEFEEVLTRQFRYNGKLYTDIKEAKIDALCGLLDETTDGVGAQTISVAVDHAEQVIAVLSWQPKGEAESPPKGRPSALYTDEAYAAAQKQCGFPMAILRSRVRQGRTLNQAATEPYVPRPRKAKEQPAAAQPEPKPEAKVERPF